MTGRRQRIELMRYLHGELSPEAQGRLRARLERDPVLAAELARLESAWSALEQPAPEPAPPGFAARIAARAAELDGELEERRATFRPAWARTAAAAALAAGIALGAGLGLAVLPPEPADRSSGAGESVVADSAPLDLDEVASASVPSLAEGYWSALEEDEGDRP